MKIKRICVYGSCLSMSLFFFGFHAFADQEKCIRKTQNNSSEILGSQAQWRAIASSFETRENGTSEKAKVDETRIYYGNPNAWARAGVIDGKKVIRSTPAWKEMNDKGVVKGSPEYDLYKYRAQREMRDAIELIAKSDSTKPYDLVGEVGAIVIKGNTVPDLTTRIIEKLENGSNSDSTPINRSIAGKSVQ